MTLGRGNGVRIMPSDKPHVLLTWVKVVYTHMSRL